MTLGRAVRLSYSFTFLSSRSFDARRHTLTLTVPCLQMSSNGSSGRADSGNAFEGNSLSSLAQGGRQTPEYLWTDSSQWESSSRQDDAVEGSSKLAGEQDEAEVSFSGHIEWSYAHDISTIIG